MAHASLLYLHRLSTTKRPPLLYVESPDGRWLTRLFSITTDSRYNQEAATLRGVPGWFTRHFSISTDSLLPRDRYFMCSPLMAHTSPLSDVSHLHRLATSKRQDRCFLCAFSKARKNHLSTQKMCLLSSLTC